MSQLEDLEKKLYEQEGESELEKRLKHRVVSPPVSKEKETFSWAPGAGVDMEKRGRIRRGLFKALSLIFFVLLFFGGAFFVFLYLGSRGGEMDISIRSREGLELGVTQKIQVIMHNTSDSVYKDAELVILLPPKSVINEGGEELLAPTRLVRLLPDLSPGEERQEEIAARFFGEEGAIKKIEVVVSYRPESFSAKFVSRSSKVLKIERVPLGISWDTPQTVSYGQDVEVQVRYNSSSGEKLGNLSLRLEYPPGFSFKDSDPKPVLGDNLWNIGDLPPAGSGIIVVRGSVVGEEGEVKTLRGGIGVFNHATQDWDPYLESSHELDIALTPLSVKGYLSGSRDGKINPGDRLFFIVKYVNNTPFPLKNVSVRTSVEGSIVDLPTLSINQGGVYDSVGRNIVWSPSNLQDLSEVKSKSGGELTFIVDSKETPPLRGPTDKNLVVRLTSFIEASGIPRELVGTLLSYRDGVEFKVNSKVIFSAKALYRYPPLPNAGPIPPRVGQKTTYSIVWEVRNFTSDLRNVEVRTTIPPNVSWEGKKNPSGANLAFNVPSREVRWKVDKLEAGRGVISPALVVSFQVSVVPSDVDVGKVVGLLNRSLFVAEDAFTGNRVERVVGPLTTELNEDSSVDLDGWHVRR